ncbi:hypothetical protein A3SI_05332 [Nitritalea halalkaliphila LW7]|uniref:Uncharacterized protein n=1 Tax=Nitritalea halalkaliphila LW7 TaxID=1189621 RepID=I5C7R9_9BACT|nr:hypothetical protein [Nitritalea halalkaliphila]EIM77871.1 hypothetical protein A3SI_05332 [Nitritalea halalkaliphila LW7]
MRELSFYQSWPQAIIITSKQLEVYVLSEKAVSFLRPILQEEPKKSSVALAQLLQTLAGEIEAHSGEGTLYTIRHKRKIAPSLISK